MKRVTQSTYGLFSLFHHSNITIHLGTSVKIGCWVGHPKAGPSDWPNQNRVPRVAQLNYPVPTMPYTV